MRAFLIAKIALAASSAALVACSGGAGVGRVPVTSQSIHQRVPPPCVPSVWASSLSANAVYGFTGPGAPCITLNGTYNGQPLSGPYGLATDNAGNLYVADSNNIRILVFTKNGTFVKEWITGLMSGKYEPVGVCVSNTLGVVGVGNQATSGSAGNVMFFNTSAANFSGPTGWASWTVKPSEGYCAFTKIGDFFVDAADANGSNRRVAYVPRGKVNLPSQALVNSGVSPAGYWVGMYCNKGTDTTVLHVGAAVNAATTQKIYGWQVTGPANGPLTFTPKPTILLTSYPTATNPLQQIAPATPGPGRKLYVADYGAGSVLDAPDPAGGAVSVFGSVTSAVGVATYPDGQN